MRKHDILRMLEPFDDEIEILLISDELGSDRTCNIYYSWDRRYDSAVIILAPTKPNREKTVELK